MPGSVLICSDEVFVLHVSQGRHNEKPDYYLSADGKRFRASKCKLLHNNTGICYVFNHL